MFAGWCREGHLISRDHDKLFVSTTCLSALIPPLAAEFWLNALCRLLPLGLCLPLRGKDSCSRGRLEGASPLLSAAVTMYGKFCWSLALQRIRYAIRPNWLSSGKNVILKSNCYLSVL